MNKTHRRIQWMLAGILVVAFMLAATAVIAQQAEEPQEEEPPEPVATVNDVQMNADQVKEALAKWYPGATVKRLIDHEIIRQEAARRGVEITDEQVAAALKERKAMPWEFQRYLGRRGLTEAQFQQQLRWDLTLGTLADDFRERFIKSQARNYYEANRSEFTTGPQVHIYELVTDDIKQAYLARERIAGGETFEAVAEEISIEDSVEVGWMARDEYHLGSHITDLGIGEITPPLREDDKYYIAYLKEYSEQREATYEQVRPQIVEKLRERVNFSEEEYLEYLARRADISIQHGDFTYLNDYFDSLDEIRVIVGGEYLSLDPKPRRLESGHLVCILKPLLQSLDAAVTWEHESQVMTAENPLGRVRLTVGETAASVGLRGVKTVELPTAPTLENGRVIGPPRTALEALGAEVIWDGVRNVLEITPPEIPERTTGGLQTNQ
ncbi:MAG: SurA N-terminal domain-containing protein [Armatimonadota bacterium]